MNQAYQGKLRYGADLEQAQGRLFIAIPCLVGSLSTPVDALLDTASQWCILPAHLADEASYEAVSDQPIQMHTRFGILVGDLVRAAVAFPPDEGEVVVIEATWFLSPEWPGPAVIGWKGCLERMKFGVDPASDAFYFGDLDE